MKRNSCFSLFLMLCVMGNITSYGQYSHNDSLLRSFSDNLCRSIRLQIDSTVIDSNNFVAVYSVKFKISAGKMISSFACSEGTPAKLCNAFYKALDTLRSTALFDSALTVGESRTFVLPVVLDYKPRPRQPSGENVTVKDIMAITSFPATDANKMKGDLKYAEMPVDCILLPVYFYQSAHAYPSRYNKKQ